MYGELVRSNVKGQLKTNVADHGLVLNRVGPRVNKPPGMAGLLFI
jgi:hypothetical protein